MSTLGLVRKAVKKYERDGLASVCRSAIQQAKTAARSDVLFKRVTALRYRAQRLRYDAPAYPYKVLTVDTDQIEEFNESISTNRGLGIIKGGSWDRAENCRSIRSTTHYRGLQQRFQEGYDWEDTEYYQQRKRSIAETDTDRLKYVGQLYRDIRDNGYRPNYEGEHDAPDTDGRQSRFQHLHSLEPLLLISRDGDFYLAEGFHRLAIAKLVGIEEIPVNILARHEEWQKIRERISRTNGDARAAGLEQYVGHPDLRDVID